MSDRSEPILRASEIGQYAYCAHAWWLGSIEGYPSRNKQELNAGSAFHVQHGAQVRAALSLRQLAYWILVLAIASALIGVWRILGM